MDIIVEKNCGRCGVSKPVGDFKMHRPRKGNKRDYMASTCKACEFKRENERKRQSRMAALAVAEKRCGSCGARKPIDMFRALRRVGGGLFVRAKMCEACESRKAQRYDDLVPAYYPDPLHAIARKWGGPVNPAPLLGLLSLPMPEADWRMAA